MKVLLTNSVLGGLFGLGGGLFTLFDTRSEGLSDLLVDLGLFSTGFHTVVLGLDLAIETDVSIAR